ncbi:MAG: GNAT family N-acetyltransferase [Candidatus Eisenbacteria sp.]|nr:GNAT family N-acetyltransferase [Candidatus Eisenbacteria bacterium]
MGGGGTRQWRAEQGIDDARFQNILENRAEATFYHTRTWARILTSAFPQLSDLSRILEIDGEAYALPLFRWRRLGGLLSTLHSSFPFLYGGPIPTTSPLVWDAVIRNLARKSGSLVVIGNPFQEGADATTQAEGPDAPASTGVSRAWETTHLLELPRTVEDFWNGILTTRKRNDIRRLTRKGVHVELSREDADVRCVYELYLKRMRTWEQRPRLIYPLGFYQAMMSVGGESVKLYVARFEGRVIGGTFTCCWNGIAHYQAGYFDHDARNLRPNVLIQDRIIQDAIRDGCRIYDMLPSAGIAAVESFKESFGGVKTRFARWEKTDPVHRLAQWIRSFREDRG